MCSPAAVVMMGREGAYALKALGREERMEGFGDRRMVKPKWHRVDSRSGSYMTSSSSLYARWH